MHIQELSSIWKLCPQSNMQGGKHDKWVKVKWNI